MIRTSLACFALLSATAFGAAPAAQGIPGEPHSFEEAFALADDREAVLDRLLPGTEEAYFYRCLHLQHTGRLDAVEPILSAWIERFGRTSRVIEIEHRQALLAWDADPAASTWYLMRTLGITFDHQPSTVDRAATLPNRLDQDAILEARFIERALQRHPGTVDGFTDEGLRALAADPLDANLLDSFLRRLERPDVPGLDQLVIRNLRERRRDFGSLPIHARLTLDQLAAIGQAHPPAANDAEFVSAVLRRLHPSEDVDWRTDAAVREAYLVQLERYVGSLNERWDSLRAHVLHHRLVHELEQGTPDEVRFKRYLALPWAGSWARPPRDGRAQHVDANAQFPTHLGAIEHAEPLVRSYLELLLVDEDSPEAFAQWLDADYLRRVFAETKILAGVGDRDRWFDLLGDPAAYERLRDRVELSFVPGQAERFGADDPIVVDVRLKNVSNLLVKVFEVDARNAFTALGREIDASLSLDGLVANEEALHSWDVDPLLRITRRFEFPSLARAGVFVIEFVGNGLSSRVVLHKGRLSAAERVGAAGHVFTVFDESGVPVEDASILFGGREFHADDRGEVVVPFASEATLRTILLLGDGAATVDRFRHLREDYALEAGALVVREDLVGGGRARLFVRPRLSVNGASAHLDLLDDAVLRIVATDVRDVSTRLEVARPDLMSAAEFTHEFAVPDDLVRLEISLTGSVQRASDGEDVTLESRPAVFELNGMLRTAETGALILSRTQDGYVLDHLGRNGEPLAGRPVQLSLSHRTTRVPFDVVLATDPNGRIELGELTDIVRLRSADLPAGHDTWQLEDEQRTYANRLHGVEGEVLRVPLVGDRADLDPSDASLLELRDGAFAYDRFDQLAVRDGFLELGGLRAGDYELRLAGADEPIQVRIAAQRGVAGWALGGARLLELEPEPLHLTSANFEGDELVARLANATADARVHVLVTRGVPAYDAFWRLRLTSSAAAREVERRRSLAGYYAERAIGSEYRYILDRRRAPVFPGVMLARPGALLNPWAFEDSDDVLRVDGGEGGKFGGRFGGSSGLRDSASASGRDSGQRNPGAYAALDFLGDDAVVLANLAPDDDGVVRVPLAELGPGAYVRVVAVDRESLVERALFRPETAPTLVDERLTTAIPIADHVIQRRRIEFLEAGETLEIEAAVGTRAEVFDTLGDVYRLFRTLSNDDDLATFAFLTAWPTLSDSERRKLYSEHACHELHVFLYEHDPAFFDAVVRPYLANKVHRTFLDRWLLDDDLSAFLEPHAFAGLNVVEKILLARRVDDPGIAALVQDRVELLPQDPVRDAALFDAIVAGDALSEANGLGKRLEELQETARRSEDRPGESGSGDFFLGIAGDRLRVPTPPGAAQADAEVADVERRGRVQQLYQPLAVTKAYIEHNYWQRRIGEQDAELIVANRFWRDFALTPAGAPFASQHVGEATKNIAEMLLALAFLDLPFEAEEHPTDEVDGTLTMRAASPLLVATQALEAATPALDGSVLVGQQYVRLDERHEYVAGRRRDKLVTGEFLVGVPYACRVVVTNPTSSARPFEVLTQVPEGSIPLLAAAETRGVPMLVEAYGTASHEYAFYFPRPGDFGHFPAHAASEGELVAFAEPRALSVVTEASTVDTDSWNYIVDRAEPNVVLAALSERNLFDLDLARLAWRMRDRAFFEAALSVLDARHVFDATLWSYALRHGDRQRTQQFLEQQEHFVRAAGPYLDAPILRIDPVERRFFEIVEFAPLIHARAHDFGEARQITHPGLDQQVQRLLHMLVHKPELDADDWLLVTTTFLAQDRFPEALAAFGRVGRANVAARLQVDYVEAYLAMVRADVEAARSIAEAYAEHPVERWRARFAAVKAQLDEAAGAARSTDENGGRVAVLEFELHDDALAIRHENVARVEVGFYETDVEFLFSANPFDADEAESVAFVRPNASDVIEPGGAAGVTRVDIPAGLGNANLVVEVRAGGIVRRRARYASELSVRARTDAGELSVGIGDRGLPAAYVKVYARRASGAIEFHKDGYTDLRGRFDYVSLTGPDAQPTERYAVLVLHPEHGAVVRELEAPLQ
ncbi:MAG: hypothetical protein WD226_05995 [Planctomycetota bacterium]